MLVQNTPQERATAARAPVREDSEPVVHLALAVTALLAELAALLGEESKLPPPPGEPAWSDELLTESETRVLRYLPTHMSAPEIAAELFVSKNTVKTHVHHLYRKLGAHSRHEAVRRARAIGLLAASRRL